MIPANPAPPDRTQVTDVIDRISRNILRTNLPYRTTRFEKSGSTIVCVRFADPELDYFMKFKRPQPEYGATAESTRTGLTREYETLQRLSKLASSSFTIAKPLFFDPELLILATTAVPGTPFLHKYRLAPRIGITGRESLTSDLYAIGQALHAFHRLLADSSDLESARRSYQYVKFNYTAKLEHAAIHDKPELHRAAESYLATLNGDLEDYSGAVLVHNDLGLHNVLCGAPPGFLDLDSMKIGQPEVDLAKLILSLVDFTMLGPIPRFRRQALGRAVRSLLAGYKSPVRQQYLKPLLVNTGLHWIIDLELRRRHQPTPIRRSYDALLIARHIEFLMCVFEDCPDVDFLM